jgi:hypothetical protein
MSPIGLAYVKTLILPHPRDRLIDRFKRCMIDRCPQCLQCRRILQRVKPRSFAFDKAHTLTKRMRHDQDIGKQDRVCEFLRT